MRPSPWRRGVSSSRRVGFGDGLSDFNALMSSGDQQFSNAWGDINSQLLSEGASQTQINAAKGALATSFNQLTQNLGVGDAGQALTMAKEYVAQGQTIAGAVGHVQGLIQAAQQGAPPVQLLEGFTGVMIGAMVTAGAFSAGIGAAIVGVADALYEMLNSANLFGSAPTGTQICPGVYVATVPQWVYNGSASDTVIASMISPVCVGFYGQSVTPGSANWRNFPDPNNPADAAWFNCSGGIINWGPAGAPLGCTASCLSTPGSTNLFGTNASSPGVPPIYQVFPEYAHLSCETYNGAQFIPGLTGFQQAFFSAWKLNRSYVLNGLKAVPDWQVLLHVARTWNAAHGAKWDSNNGVWTGAPMTTLQAADPGQFSNYGQPCSSVPYESILVGDLLNKASGDPMMLGGSLNIAQAGPLANVKPLPSNLQPGARPFSISTKTVAGAAVVGGVGAAALGVYAHLTGQSLAGAAAKLLGAAKGSLGHLFSSVGESAETAAEVATNETSVAEEAKTHRKTSHVQSLLFSKRAGWTVESARDWAWSNGYRSGKTHETENHIRLRQFPPHEGLRYRTVTFGRGISAVIAA